MHNLNFDILQNRTVIVFDTETTGTDPRIPYVQIASLSAAVYDVEKKSIIATFDQFVHLNLETAEQIAVEDELEVRHAGQKYENVVHMLKGCNWPNRNKDGTEKEVVQNFINFLKQYDNPIVVAFNSRFDMKMVNSTAAKYGLENINYATVDLMNWANLGMDPIIEYLVSQNDPEGQKMLNIIKPYELKSYNLGNVAKALGCQILEAHISLNDVLMTCEVLNKLIKFINYYKPVVPKKYFANSRNYYKDKMQFFKKQNQAKWYDYNKKQRILKVFSADGLEAAKRYVDVLRSRLQREINTNKPNKRYCRAIGDGIIALLEQIQNYNGNNREIKKIIFSI
jgi:DNA polymerase III epsilon subunit-like protein